MSTTWTAVALDDDGRYLVANLGDSRRLDARAGDRLLLCSDGLSDVVDDHLIAAALQVHSEHVCADRLIEMALTAGGRDNISVVVVDVLARDNAAGGWIRCARHGSR